MELSKLRELVLELRALGVTKYRVDGVELELGALPAQAPKVDLSQEGRAVPKRSAELQAALARLDPRYSDEALFSIVEGKQ